jgi:hypothetical protein
MMFMLHQFSSVDTFLSLFPPFLLRLAGGIGGIRLDIAKTPHVAYLVMI